MIPVWIIAVLRTFITSILTVLVLVTKPATGDTFAPGLTLELIRGAA